MSLKNNIKTSFIVCLIVVTLLAFLQNCKKNTSEPNVVLIVLDTLRADHLPCYGYKHNTAPFLSQIASQGVVFENALSASSWTAPSTASILTSLYPFQHGVTTGYLASKFFRIKINRIPAKAKTLTEVLKETGYKTYGISDNINICRKLGFTQGFDRFKRFSYEEDWKMNSQLKEWSEEIKAQEKYFLYIHYNDCHTPLHKRAPYYREKEDPLTDLIAQYDSEISYVDAKIKEMYEFFGWDKNTLLIVTADHGEEMKERGRWGHGNSLYTEVIHIPFIIYFPKNDRVHKKINTYVSNIDILPTVRAFLRIKSSPVESGVNLMPLIRGKNEKDLNERYIFSHILKHSKKRDGKKSFYRATIFKHWKSIYRDRFQEKMEKEFYNLKDDPGEKRNIFWENKTLANRLFIKFIGFEKKCKKYTQETADVKLDKKKMEELKSLGYVK